jgi:hypothetical protein
VHCGIEPATLPQLQPKTFREIARAHASRLKSLDNEENITHGGFRRAELRRNIGYPRAQVTRFIYAVYQRTRYQALLWVERSH